MPRIFLACLVLFLALGLAPRAAIAADVIEGPVAAQVVRVIDGDTLKLRVHIWLNQTVIVDVRIAGIDAPELHGKCAHERQMAEAARAYLASIADGRDVLIGQVRNDKYGGRVVADVGDAQTGDFGQAMLGRNLARAYDGRKRQPWCEAAG